MNMDCEQFREAMERFEGLKAPPTCYSQEEWEEMELHGNLYDLYPTDEEVWEALLAGRRARTPLPPPPPSRAMYWATYELAYEMWVERVEAAQANRRDAGERKETMNPELEPETVLPTRLHDSYEIALAVLDEAEARQVDVADLRAEVASLDDKDDLSETIDDTLERISDAGYAVVEEHDCLVIYRHGTEPDAVEEDER